MPALYTSALVVFYIIAGALIVFYGLRSARRLPISYDLIYSMMDEAVVVLDSQQLILSLNPSAERLFDKVSSAYYLRPIDELLPRVPIFPSDMTRTHTFECTLGDGIQCLGQSIPMIRGRVVIGRLLVLRDVTLQKQAETDLRASEQRAKSILDAVPDMMFRFHQDGTLLGYKAEQNQLYGLNVRINEPPQNNFSPDFIDLMLNAIQETLETGHVDTWVYEYEMPIGGIRQYEARIAPCGMDEVIILVQDVTERTHADREASATENARKRGQALGKFIREAAHEFRTPITIIKTTTYLLSRHTDPEKRQHNIAQLKEQVERLTALLNRRWTPLVDDGQ